MSSESEGDGDESLEEVVGVPAMRPVPPSTVVGVVQGLVDVELSRSRLGPCAPPAEVGPRGGQDIGLKWLRCEHVDIFIFSLSTLGWKHINLNGSEVNRGATSLLDGNTSSPTQPTHSRIHICLLYFVFCQGYYLLPVTVSVLNFLLLQKNKCFSSWQSTVLLSFCVCLDILDQIWSSVLKR